MTSDAMQVASPCLRSSHRRRWKRSRVSSGPSLRRAAATTLRRHSDPRCTYQFVVHDYLRKPKCYTATPNYLEGVDATLVRRGAELVRLLAARDLGWVGRVVIERHGTADAGSRVTTDSAVRRHRSVSAGVEEHAHRTVADTQPTGWGIGLAGAAGWLGSGRHGSIHTRRTAR
jgi:hypothetical protein